MKNKYTSLIVFLALIISLQAIGSAATFSSVTTWYPTLNKVSWNPPAWVFGPVWTMLYFMIAISGWRIWIKIGKEQIKHKAMLCYFLQLSLNLLWSIFFFALKNPVAALVDILVLIIAIVITIRYFAALDKLSAMLLIPYFLWVSYAITLNAGIVYLN